MHGAKACVYVARERSRLTADALRAEVLRFAQNDEGEGAVCLSVSRGLGASRRRKIPRLRMSPTLSLPRPGKTQGRDDVGGVRQRGGVRLGSRVGGIWRRCRAWWLALVWMAFARLVRSVAVASSLMNGMLA